MTITRTTPLEDLPQFLSPSELSAWMGLGRSLVYELLRRGELEHVRFGRIIRIPKVAIAKLVIESSRRREDVTWEGNGRNGPAR